MADIQRIIKQINEICKYCIVIVHAGDEFSDLPMPYTRNIFFQYLQFGADIVVGHHPHVVQNYEIIGDKIIFYSLRILFLIQNIKEHNLRPI